MFSRWRIQFVVAGLVLVIAACGGSDDGGGDVGGSETTAAQDSDSGSSDESSTEDPADESGSVDTALSTDPIDPVALVAGPVATASGHGQCPFTGSVVDAFVASHEIPAEVFKSDLCKWSTAGFVNRFDVFHGPVSNFDVAAMQEGSTSGSVAEAQDGPGTDAVMYFDDDESPRPRGYFFVVGDLAVDFSVYSTPAATEEEMRAIADEIASLVGSAEEIEDWYAAPSLGEDPACSLWSDESIANLFGASSASHFSGGLSACQWTSDLNKLELYFTEASYVANLIDNHGAATPDIGETAALLSEDHEYGALTTLAFTSGATTLSVVVDSTDSVAQAEALARNLAARLP